MKWLKENWFIPIIILLFSLWMWEANRTTREMKSCEGMTQQECQAYQEIWGNRDDRGW